MVLFFGLYLILLLYFFYLFFFRLRRFRNNLCENIISICSFFLFFFTIYKTSRSLEHSIFPGSYKLTPILSGHSSLSILNTCFKLSFIHALRSHKSKDPLSLKKTLRKLSFILLSIGPQISTIAMKQPLIKLPFQHMVVMCLHDAFPHRILIKLPLKHLPIRPRHDSDPVPLPVLKIADIFDFVWILYLDKPMDVAILEISLHGDSIRPYAHALAINGPVQPLSFVGKPAEPLELPLTFLPRLLIKLIVLVNAFHFFLFDFGLIRVPTQELVVYRIFFFLFLFI